MSTTKNYLDDNGLLYFWNKIKNYVTTALANSGFTSNTGTITKVKTTAGAHTAVTVTSGDAEFNVPTATSHLTNDSGFITTSDIPEGAAASTSTPLMDGTASVGSETTFARGDHRHPTDTTRAALASPAFTGIPTAPTAAAGTNTTQIATTAFVTSAISTASAGLASFQGTVDAASTITGADYKSGWYWVVSTAGTYVGETCEAGDMIFAVADKGNAYAASDFSVVQNNMDMHAITNTEIDTITA